MEDPQISPDAMMIVAGFVISLVAVLELYPAWKQARSDNHGSPVHTDDQPATEE